MDVFVEHMVKRRADGAVWAARAGVLVAGLLVCTAAAVFVPAFAFVIWAGVLFGLYKFYTWQDLEFEYIVTNGEMDVDKITAKTSRKRVLTVSAKEFELLAPVGSEAHKAAYEAATFKTKIDASGGDGTRYFAIFNDTKLGRTRLTFSPDERMLKEFQRYAPRSVNL